VEALENKVFISWTCGLEVVEGILVELFCKPRGLGGGCNTLLRHLTKQLTNQGKHATRGHCDMIRSPRSR